MSNDPSSDFFRYGRGYALYSQGRTDVGGLQSTDSNPVTDSERIQAAVERDTLLLARSAGQGLSLEEYGQLHKRVQGLYTLYLDGKINNATYQERLWSLPDRARSNRKKKSPHYSPARDSAGNPIAHMPGADLIPSETMTKLSPGIANVPTPKLADLLRPPGDGDVPHMPGAPPIATASPATGAPPPIPDGRRGGSLLDKIQTGLDAVGVVEPTPFADGTNAAISAVRALTDRQNAGEHLRNAGISLVSMIPYIGDAAKLAKYGRTASGGSGRMANMLGPIAGMLGGGAGGGGSGGSGGGDNTTPPIEPSGGGGGGGIGTLLESVTRGIGSLAYALGPAGIAIAAAAVGLRAFVHWIGQVDAKSRKMIEDNRGLAQYNGSLAGSYATLDNERLLREINKSSELSGPLGRLTKNQSNFEEAKEDLFLPFQKLFVDFQAFSTQMATYAIQVIDFLEPISEILEAWYGEEKDKNSATNVVDFLAREANARMRTRKL